MRFAGSHGALAEPGEELAGKVNHVQGQDPRKWQLDLPTYGRVTYRGIYPKVDAVFYGNQQQLEFDLVLQPGADPGRIRMDFGGAESLALEGNVLLVRTPGGDLRLPLPSIYQRSGKGQRAVAGGYTLTGKNEVGFRVEKYDRSRELIIDPTIVYSGLLGGGTFASYGQSIAVDSSGNAYVAGYTYASDFPTVNAAHNVLHVTPDAYVTKINSSGTAIVYSTFVGGNNTDVFYGIAVDGSNNAYMTGFSASTDFPVLSAYQSTLKGSADGVVVKLGPTGSVVYSTYVGLTGTTNGRAIAVDSSGNAYVTGIVSGTVPSTVGAYQTAPQGGQDGFVAKFSSAGLLSYCTYLGGTGTDAANAIALDSGNNAYIAGETGSTVFADAPSGGAQSANAGQFDGFVAKLDSTGASLAYFTFLGGSLDDHADAIAVDSGGNAYVGGYTSSTDLLTTGGALQTAYGGGLTDGFAAKLNSTGTTFNYITYLGAGHTDQVFGLAIDASGNAYVTGKTQSALFPTVAPIQASMAGSPTSLFQTTNGGTSWAAFDNNIPGQVTNVLPDPANPGTIVAATDSGIFRTTNGGTSWTQVSTAANVSISRSLASSATIYALSGSNPYRSTDGGATWSPLTGVGPGSALILADPLSANTAYVTHSANTVYKTTNGGSTWTTISTGLISFIVQSFLASTDGSLYIDTDSNAIYKSVNQGANWSSVSTGLTGLGVANGLTVSISNHLVLYRINGSTIDVTTNGGTNWGAITGSLPGTPVAVAVSPSNASLLYSAITVPLGVPAVYASTDGGATWNAISTGLGIASVSGIVFDPATSGTAYVIAASAVSAFVAEINTAGSQLVYSTFLAGSSSYGSGIAIGGGGDAFVTGLSLGSFPVTTAALDGGFGTGAAFVARIAGSTASCSYTVSPLSQTIYSPAQSVPFTVLAPSGCTWTASSNQPWASIIQGTSGAGSGSGTVYVLANTSGATQAANLTIAGQTFVLTQAPSSCTYTLNASTLSLPVSGGPVTVTVTTGAGCPWSTVNHYPFTVGVTNGSGTGNGTVNLTVGTNASQVTRQLTVPIGGSSVIIFQAGALSITKSHVGNFQTGQNGAAYTIVVTNNSSSTTSGTVSVQEIIPSGLSLQTMSGSGWGCLSGVCSRSDALAAGASYPAITVTVNVASNATSPQINSVGLSLGGASAGSAVDITTIVTPLLFVPITPCRVVDTRKFTGAFGPPSIAGGTSRDFPIPTGNCPVPSNAQAYSMNVAVVPPAPLGFLTLWPTGQSQPRVSTINSVDGRTKSNAAIVPAGTNGSVSVFASNTTDVVLDINGYFIPASQNTGLAFYTVTPCRIVDTRKGTGPLNGPALIGQQSRTFPILSSSCGIPNTAQAYSLNFAAVPPAPLGFLTAYPTGVAKPVVASLNDVPGTIVANAVIVPAGTSGSIDVFASNNTDVVIDVDGYFAPMATGGMTLNNVEPCRVIDTRKPAGSPSFSGELDINIVGSPCSIPSNAQAYVLSATVVPPQPLGFLTLWPQGQTQPKVATLNAVDAVTTSNLAIVSSTNGSIAAFASNPTYLVLDIFGYFAQ